MAQIDDFLRDLDASWSPAEGVELSFVGSAALMLQTDYVRGTKDGDVLRTADFPDAARERLLGIAGQGTALATRHHMYIEFVAPALLFLPREPRWHDVDAQLRCFRVRCLDATDVAVSKLIRFNGNDRDDIDAMIAKGVVSRAAMLERLRGAIERFTYDARSDQLPRIVRNFHQVERDMFFELESPIVLPPHSMR